MKKHQKVIDAVYVLGANSESKGFSSEDLQLFAIALVERLVNTGDWVKVIRKMGFEPPGYWKK